jgi:hypothetical protein
VCTHGAFTNDFIFISLPGYTTFTWTDGSSEVDDAENVVRCFLLTMCWTERYDENCTGSAYETIQTVWFKTKEFLL